MPKNDSRNERKRLSHYVPVELIEVFDAAAANYPVITKQGFFQIVILVGLDALEDNYERYWPEAFKKVMQLENVDAMPGGGE